MSSVLLASAAVLGSGVVLTGVGAPATAATRTAVDFRITPSLVNPGQPARAAGKVTGSPANRLVLLQRRSGSAWRTLTSRRTTSAGSFSFTLPTGAASRYVYRVGVRATSTATSAYTKPVQLTVGTLPAPMLFSTRTSNFANSYSWSGVVGERLLPAPQPAQLSGVRRVVFPSRLGSTVESVIAYGAGAVTAERDTTTGKVSIMRRTASTGTLLTTFTGCALLYRVPGWSEFLMLRGAPATATDPAYDCRYSRLQRLNPSTGAVTSLGSAPEAADIPVPLDVVDRYSLVIGSRYFVQAFGPSDEYLVWELADPARRHRLSLHSGVEIQPVDAGSGQLVGVSFYERSVLVDLATGGLTEWGPDPERTVAALGDARGVWYVVETACCGTSTRHELWQADDLEFTGNRRLSLLPGYTDQLRDLGGGYLGRHSAGRTTVLTRDGVVAGETAVEINALNPNWVQR